ncbi:outer membrane lipoprotein chaperone LolA [Alcaligenaceae bacterium CGII-47]|nr:outer membrane lipoprotein chaperone LolA [Alcaligenaceae bacterium CGII-47]
MMIRRWMCALLIACLPIGVWAADARSQLNDFVTQVHRATGAFEQGTLDKQGQVQRPQQGEFSFERPGKFRWAVQKPYAQLIVSDGQFVFQYDPDLAQVTQRDARASIGTSPAALLFGSGSLDEAFNLQSQPERDGMQWLRAVPKGADAGFSYVDIGFAQGLPRQIELLDAFGQTTRIVLSNIQSNPTIPAAQFTFTVPAGVDLVRMP